MLLKKGIFLLVSISLLFNLFSCSKKSSEPYIPPPVKNNLVFERSDGVEVHFKSNTYVWCGHWEEDIIPVETVHILVGFDPAEPQDISGWKLQAVISDVKIGEEMTFPNTFIWNQPKEVMIFINDPPNQLSTEVEESRGGIVFQKLVSGTNGEVEFSIDAVIGSEYYGGDSLKVSGTFYAPVTGAPVLESK